MAASGIVSHVRRRREALGLSQAALAQRTGVSRQAILAAEAARHVPSTTLALALARSLGCAVEELFELAPAGSLEVVVAPHSLRTHASERTRVALARVDGRWVAHRLADEAPQAADGILVAGDARRGSATALGDLGELERNVLVAGCAPLLALLAQRVGRRYGDARVTWLPANSSRALELLADGLVHVAGIHLADERGGADNLAAVRQRFADRRMWVVNLTRWRQGLLVPAGNPLALRDATDLARPGLRIAAREEGAGASALLARLLREAGGEPPRAPAGPRATSHGEVASLVRCAAADVGVGIESAALTAGVAFVPLTEERFDLVLPAERADARPVSRVLDLLADAGFHAEVAVLPGYDSGLRGQLTTLEPRGPS